MVNMPVVNEQGLVGKVILTARNYSQVLPLYNTLFKVSARIQTSQAYGIVSWEGEQSTRLVMNYVPQTIQVDSGQVIETSGYSNHFPPNIPIGTVTETRPIQGKEIQEIFIDPFVSLHKVSEGFVVKYTPDSTLINLNAQYRERFK